MTIPSDKKKDNLVSLAYTKKAEKVTLQLPTFKPTAKTPSREFLPITELANSTQPTQRNTFSYVTEKKSVASMEKII